MRDSHVWCPRRCLRAGHRWQDAVDGAYIRWEASRLFRLNRSVDDPHVLAALLFEGDARLALAVHYNNPHPRLSHYKGNVSEDDVGTYREGTVNLAYMASYKSHGVAAARDDPHGGYH